MSNQITEDLFKTNAVRVAPADTPFWYTSGKLGPFFINTHFLIKDEQTAGEILKVLVLGNIENTLKPVLETEIKLLRRSLMH